MEKRVNFRDRQELQAGDLTNLGDYASESLDRAVREGLTDEKKFSGFAVSKTGATEVTVSPGTYWSNGERYIREQSHEIDFLSQLPLATKKIAAIIATGQTIDTGIEPRDFLIDVETGATEPDSVAMQKLRYAEFQLAYGTENATPQRPTVSTDNLVIAWVTLSTTGVDSIEAASENEFMSTKRLAQRATELEVWRTQAGEQITTLGTDITTLATRVGQMANSTILARIFADVALIKAQLELEDNYSGYGNENFLAVDQSISDPTAPGYSVKVEEGMRFPDANAASVAITLFNPLDPSVKVGSNGLLLPKYTEVRRLSVDTFYQQLSLSQYEYQEVTFKKIAMSAQRLRFGLAMTVCNNSEFWRTGTFDYRKGIFTDKLGRTYQALGTDWDTRWTGSEIANSKEKWIRLQQFWYDTEVEYYQDRVVTDFTVSGSMVAQTFLNTQGGWLTSLDLFFTQVAATGNVRLLVTKTASGKPDLERVVAETTVDAAALVKGSNASQANHWTRIPLVPTALEAGERYAIVLLTGGDHYVGLTQGANYAAGTLFYSTDGAFFQGDLTLDMMFRANFASFDHNRAEIDLGSLNLAGGINDLDIAYEGVVPSGTELGFEVRPEGSSRWYSVGAGDNPFSTLPALVSFRAVLIGTKDLMPGFRLTGSNVKVSRPATAMTHFTKEIILPAPTQSVKVVVILDMFNEANHEFDIVLNDITNASLNKVPASEVNEVLEEKDGTRKRIRRTFEWNATQLPVATSKFVIKSTGTATLATEIFHVERLTYLTF
ncbi:hypothetical protein EHS39_09085 [Ensifer sp. MPMI2T]|nr:hypothetical protein EHS39_09085 [Ensifer sp. MPMI2T]